MNWILLLFTVSGFQGILLSVIFMIQGRQGRKFFLGLYLLLFSLTILHYVVFWYQAMELPQILRFTGAISSWGMPAALLFYFKNYRPNKKNLIHLVPLVIFTIYWILAFNLVFSQETLQQNGPWIGLLKITLFLSYGYFFIRSANSPLDQWIVIAYFSFVAANALYWLSISFSFYTTYFDYSICAVFVILTYTITYLSQLKFLNSRVTQKYATSSLTEEDGHLLVEKIHSLMHQHHFYRDQNFSLNALALALKEPKYRVSQALNSFSKRSFSDILNEYRIQEAREKLHSPTYKHLKVEAIGEEVGFSNKVSFYKHFKRIHGMAPGEYRLLQK